MPIVVKKGDTVRISGINNLPTTTNIHWHGLVAPNDQDGPGKIIEPGKRFTYSFKVNDSGTYWYHSHYRPVDQVDNGLYAPFIIKSPADDLYSGDHVLVWMTGILMPRVTAYKVPLEGIWRDSVMLRQ